ncbi:MAG: hypothetical protein ACRC31_01840 [Cetobacterium sp.]
MFTNQRVFSSIQQLDPYFLVDINSNGLLVLATDKSIGVVNDDKSVKKGEYSVTLNREPIKARYINTVNVGDGLTIDNGMFIRNNSNPLYRCIYVNGDLCIACQLETLGTGGGGGGSEPSLVQYTRENCTITYFKKLEVQHEQIDISQIEYTDFILTHYEHLFIITNNEPFSPDDLLVEIITPVEFTAYPELEFIYLENTDGLTNLYTIYMGDNSIRVSNMYFNAPVGNTLYFTSKRTMIVNK